MADYDLAVIGAGPGGLTVAAAAARFGRRVVLFEKAEMGGDCLNSGCVPSKALLAAARRAQLVRDSGRFGISAGEPKVDFAAVQDHVRGAIAAIAPHDSQARFEALGVTVVRAAAGFRDSRSVVADGKVYHARRFVIATGSRPMIPAIPGLATVPYLTNETIFDLSEVPRRLLIVGGGPIGIEMAQAFRRLGAGVTVIEAADALGRDDPELAAVVLAKLAAEGVDIRTRTTVQDIALADGGIRLTAGGTTIDGSHLLVAAGRTPNLAGLNLTAAGIAHSDRGIIVDRGLRTSNRRVYAIGDVAGGPQFTHVAGHHAGLVIRNALFGLPVSVAGAVIPRVTFTDPELAQAGLTEPEARAAHGDAVTVLRQDLAGNDRAVADGAPFGLLKAVIGRRGRILGVGIAGERAGDLIQPWVLAMASGLGVRSLVDAMVPYPTLGDAGRRAALNYFSGMATNPWLRRVMDFVGRTG